MWIINIMSVVWIPIVNRDSVNKLHTIVVSFVAIWHSTTAFQKYWKDFFFSFFYPTKKKKKKKTFFLFSAIRFGLYFILFRNNLTDEKIEPFSLGKFTFCLRCFPFSCFTFGCLTRHSAHNFCIIFLLNRFQKFNNITNHLKWILSR